MVPDPRQAQACRLSLPRTLPGLQAVSREQYLCCTPCTTIVCVPEVLALQANQHGESQKASARGGQHSMEMHVGMPQTVSKLAERCHQSQ